MALFKSMQTDSVDSSDELGYLLRERISPQWVDFLQAFSAEMQSQLSLDEYRDLLKSMGTRMATRLSLETKDTIEELEIAINQKLSAIRWGYVKLTDSGSQLQIQHFLNPLSEALGTDMVTAGGFLEGVYEHWFRALGADEGLTVKQLADMSTSSVLEFQFGRHA